jgi:uncharacterized protein YbjT (DUF2867 family)
MAEKILVTGATGTVGRELVARLLADGVEVKAATRNPALAAKLFGPQAEPVELDFDVTATWDAAVQWADRVFLVPPPFDPHGDERLVPFLDWAVQSGARHVVLLSAMGIEARERLHLRRIERRLERTGVEWTFLRPNVYMQNFARGFLARDIRERDVVHLPVGQAHVSFVDSGDVADAAARVLGDDRHFRRSYTLTGPEALDHDRVADLLGRAAGREIRYQPISEEAMARSLASQGWPADQAGTFAGLMTAIREGRRSDVTGDVERLTGHPPGSFEAFVLEHVDAWR